MMSRLSFLAALLVIAAGCASVPQGSGIGWSQRFSAPTTAQALDTATTISGVTEHAAPVDQAALQLAGSCVVKAPAIPPPPVRRAVMQPSRAAEVAVDLDLSIRQSDGSPGSQHIRVSVPRVAPGELKSVLLLAESDPGFAWLRAVCDDDLTGPIVAELQAALAARAGYTEPANGLDSEAFRVAIERYKRLYGLYGDGLTDALFESLGVPFPATPTASR